jgi:transcriptional regulator with XRE-family HTH domain
MFRQPSQDTHNGNRSLPDQPIEAGEVIAFGEFLRTAREQRGITLDQICRETKIPRRHLEALEHGQLAAVPGGTYRRGEIVAYAKVVGLDRNVALHRLERASETLDRSAPAAASPQHEDLRTRPVVLVVLLAATAFISYMTWNRGAQSASGGQAVTDSVNQPATAARAATAPTEAPGGDARSAAPQTSTVPPPLDALSTMPVEPAAPSATAAGVTTIAGVGFVIVSDPPGARVTVDGIGWGSTPLTIRNLAPGVRQIRVSKPGYESATSTVRLVDGQRTSLSIALHSTTPSKP